MNVEYLCMEFNVPNAVIFAPSLLYSSQNVGNRFEKSALL